MTYSKAKKKHRGDVVVNLMQIKKRLWENSNEFDDFHQLSLLELSRVKEWNIWKIIHNGMAKLNKRKKIGGGFIPDLEEYERENQIKPKKRRRGFWSLFSIN